MKSPIKSIEKKRILVSPLNWGLGHVTRTIPVINQLIKQENEVLICCSLAQEAFYRDFFPDLWYITHEGYPFSFKGKGNWISDILLNYFKLKRFKKQEQKKIEKWVAIFNPDLIISDQRFGFYHPDVKSVIISHQLTLPLPKWNFVGQFINTASLRKFDEVWVPDDPGHKLSGALSNNNKLKKEYIGWCSRFEDSEIKNGSSSYDYLAIISGPKPYNKQFLNQIFELFEKLNKRTVIIVPGELASLIHQYKTNCAIEVQPCFSRMEELIYSSKVIISRCGYSTLMDLKRTGNKAVLIPTPGQQEQLYLAKIHSKNPNWEFVASSELNEFFLESAFDK